MDPIFLNVPSSSSPFQRAENNTYLEDMMLSCLSKGKQQQPFASAASYSHYHSPIVQDGKLHGYSREAGGASSEVQKKMMHLLLSKTEGYSIDQRATLLGTVYIESGFNPDAAAKESSASGLFQFINDTGRKFGLNNDNRFSPEANIDAGLGLFKENERLVNKKYPQLSGDARAVKLYALHHDGPSLQYGGELVAKKRLLPMMDTFREMVEEYVRSSK